MLHREMKDFVCLRSLLGKREILLCTYILQCSFRGCRDCVFLSTNNPSRVRSGQLTEPWSWRHVWREHLRLPSDRCWELGNTEIRAFVHCFSACTKTYKYKYSSRDTVLMLVHVRYYATLVESYCKARVLQHVAHEKNSIVNCPVFTQSLKATMCNNNWNPMSCTANILEYLVCYTLC